MKIINISDSVEKNLVENPDKINIIYQFFIHHNKRRNKELKKVLKFNVENKFINKIYLLNEKIYNKDELGIESDKIEQINIGSRLKFKNVFNYININKIHGYNVIINADIFLDETINNLKYSNIHLQKQMFALLRYEYNQDDINDSEVFGPRFDSQDTWIFHSNFNPKEDEEKVFNFEFGKPGCDNKFLYLMNILGYQIINDPKFIKTYHFHTSEERDYGNQDYVANPWAVCLPANVATDRFRPTLGIDIYDVAKHTNNFREVRFEDNYILYNYIRHKMSLNQNFIVPRIAGIENNYAVEVCLCKDAGTFTPEFQNYVNSSLQVMKNNAGIKLSNINSIIKYSEMYMEAFNHCELYTGWEPHGEVYKYITKSHDYIKEKCGNRKILWAFGLDIYHYIKTQPWTHSLEGKRVLIISSFEDSIKEKIPIRSEIYGIDLFPNCEILTIKPPQTQGSENSEEFDIELNNFCSRLDLIRDNYDIALVSCGGYGNLVCNYIYKSGKSAIYVGGVLQMYFGILGGRWLRERPDIIRLYLNKHWTKPKNSEKPQNYQNVEGSAYW